MRIIGWGWQYTVYDLGNGRVRKVFNSPVLSYLIIFSKIFPFRRQRFWDIPKYIPKLRIKAHHSIEFLKESNLPLSWFSNPLFTENLDYEQDMVTDLQTVLNNSLSKDSKELLDKTAVFCKVLAQNGVIDKFFNVSKNFGVDKNGNIVMIDIGELVTAPDKIQEQIESRPWASEAHSEKITQSNLRRYFIDRMDSLFGVVK